MYCNNFRPSRLDQDPVFACRHKICNWSFVQERLANVHYLYWRRHETKRNLCRASGSYINRMHFDKVRKPIVRISRFPQLDASVLLQLDTKTFEHGAMFVCLPGRFLAMEAFVRRWARTAAHASSCRRQTNGTVATIYVSVRRRDNRVPTSHVTLMKVGFNDPTSLESDSPDAELVARCKQQLIDVARTLYASWTIMTTMVKSEIA